MKKLNLDPKLTQVGLTCITNSIEKGQLELGPLTDTILGNGSSGQFLQKCSKIASTAGINEKAMSSILNCAAKTIMKGEVDFDSITQVLSENTPLGKLVIDAGKLATKLHIY